MGYHSFSSNLPSVGHRFTLPPPTAVAPPIAAPPPTAVAPPPVAAAPSYDQGAQQTFTVAPPVTWNQAPAESFQSAPKTWQPPVYTHPPDAVYRANDPLPHPPPPAVAAPVPSSSDAARQRFLVSSNSNFNNPPPLAAASPVARALADRHQPTGRYQDIYGNWRNASG